MGSRHSLLFTLLLTVGFVLSSSLCAAQSEPQALQAWTETAYRRRFFLKVEPAGEAGNVDLHRDPFTAGIVLPLRTTNGPDGKPVPEHVLLMGEDGNVQSVLLRPAASGLGVEVLFRTQPGLRRFCLYADDRGTARRASANDFWPVETSVEMRGRSAPPEFTPAPSNPLTLSRFQKLEESLFDGVGNKQVPDIDARENPFLSVSVDQLGHIQRTVNPARYVALYEAFLRTPVAGKYTFSIDTPGVAHLLIDGLSVLSFDTAEPERTPFAQKKAVELGAGLHRVVVHYAEANANGRSNAELARFGLRLHWQPPWASGLMCIPPQAFPKTIPASVTRHEVLDGNQGRAEPYIHLELLGRVRCAAHLGPQGVREKALMCARMIDGDEAYSIDTAEGEVVTQTVGNAKFAWVPVGADVSLFAKREGLSSWSRTVKISPGDPVEVVDLQGEMQIKSAPDFLYVDAQDRDHDETAHIHIQSALSPVPEIVSKERIETRLLPPPARPMGEFELRWHFAYDGRSAAPPKPPADAQQEVTPFENGRRRQRVSFPAGELDPLAQDGHWKLVFTLCVGGVDCESIVFRLLHAEKPWPGKIVAGPGDLFFEPAAPAPLKPAEMAPQADGTVAFWKYERVLMLIRRQSEAEYRNFAPLKALARLGLGSDALFLGDPLIEGLPAGANKEPFGIAATLTKDTPGLAWKYVYVPGPHRYLPIFTMLSELEHFQQALGGAPFPKQVVVSLGSGDAARQTPIYTFDRALDALLSRLKAFGAKKIVLAGVVPEVGREANAESYQQRVLDLQRQHHVDSVDIFHAWTSQSNWARHYALEGENADASTYGPLPNAEALIEIAKMIEERVK